MNPYYQDDWSTIYHGNCLEILSALPDASAIVTDPPYELGFMGKSWDSRGVSFQKETWEIIRKSCKSGAPLLSFGGTRTFHRIACAIEDAGWEIRDTLAWVYGSGFPKSLDISKAVDYDACREELTTKLGRKPTKDELKEAWTGFRKVVGQRQDILQKQAADIRSGKRKIVDALNAGAPERNNGFITVSASITAPATLEAQLWEGYGTALKPAYEPVILAMNPLDGTFANNALTHGVAGLNIDECRIEYQGDTDPRTFGGKWRTDKAAHNVYEGGYEGTDQTVSSRGRFPANFIHDGSQEVVGLFPNSRSTGGCTVKRSGGGNVGTGKANEVWRTNDDPGYGDNGSAARFFYCAKASKAERDKGCEGLEATTKRTTANQSGRDAGAKLFCQRCHKRQGACSCDAPEWGYENNATRHNNHPTVKPLALMEYLVKLVKMPEYNLIVDTFMGSGTTLLACIRLGIPCIGIDNDEHSCEIAARRCIQAEIELRQGGTKC